MNAGPYERTRPRKNRARDLEAAEQLDAAMNRDRAACRGDDRFTRDAARANNAVEGELLATCLGCPLRAACAEYAETMKPRAGFWAGRWRGRIPKDTYLAGICRTETGQQTAERTIEVREKVPSSGTDAETGEALKANYFPRREMGKGPRP
ncbi:hypothetical protein GCM10009847_25620 [Leucobacter tardus]|uniref:WhiB family transcriptional regulator n=1 Tax=Leucobacter tardus TaxID=501483 RepID=A0A939QD25_9MICO|nr:WhiB family transcriptional regulator [Leucobacter tardus]MBO2989930.1 WhiB family transcriptional regulator [Leucobacter tardus]